MIPRHRHFPLDLACVTIEPEPVNNQHSKVQICKNRGKSPGLIKTTAVVEEENHLKNWRSWMPQR